MTVESRRSLSLHSQIHLFAVILFQTIPYIEYTENIIERYCNLTEIFFSWSIFYLGPRCRSVCTNMVRRTYLFLSCSYHPSQFNHSRAHRFLFSYQTIHKSRQKRYGSGHCHFIQSCAVPYFICRLLISADMSYHTHRFCRLCVPLRSTSMSHAPSCPNRCSSPSVNGPHLPPICISFPHTYTSHHNHILASSTRSSHHTFFFDRLPC